MEKSSAELLNENKEFEEFVKAVDAEVKVPQIDQIVEGTVVDVTDTHVLVDVGYKTQGKIPIEEFMRHDGTIDVQVGDRVDVLMKTYENDDGVITLAKREADRMKIWDEISRICENGDIVEGTIIERIKGGLTVDIGIKAFLPGSQIDLHPIKDPDSLIGKTMEFKIIKFNRKRNNIVVSRRAILEEQRDKLKRETLKKIKVGADIKGVIKNITDYGVFIDLGGIDGLLHITDISWGRINHPQEMFNIGDEIAVRVLHFDEETERVSLGYKQRFEDPWSKVHEKYPIGSKVECKVISLTNYGAFVELEEGIEGLIHISEMSWFKKVQHPSELLAVGDIVEAVVLSIDEQEKRISLGLKQAEPSPWEKLQEKYPPGTKIKGKIQNITDFGIFVEVDEGVVGLVHISDISWGKPPKNLHELYKKGDEIEVMVLNINPDESRFSLGIKQLTRDPWEDVEKKYPLGFVVKGRVSSVTGFGVFVELEEGIEGLIHRSDILKIRKKENVKVDFKEGDEIEALVVGHDRMGRKVKLSLNALTEQKEKENMEEYLKKQKSTVAPKSPFEEAIEKKLKKERGEE